MPNVASAPTTRQGSLAGAIEGDYEFSISEVLGEAWARTKGCKATFLAATLLYIAVLIPVNLLIGIATAIFNRVGLDILDVLTQMAAIGVMMPIVAGLWVLGIRRSMDVAIRPTTILSRFHLFIPLLILTLLTYILIIIGFALLIIPGIYLAVSYSMAVPLVADKRLGTWEALETSRKAVTHHWFGIAGLALTLALINLAAIFTFGIGLIWTLPLSYVAMGILYRTVFGAEPETLTE